MIAVNQNIGDPISLRCDVNTVRGITSSSIDVVWMTDGGELRKEHLNTTGNKTEYTDYYNDSRKLDLMDDNTVYWCQVFVNGRLVKNGNMTLKLTGKKFLVFIESYIPNFVCYEHIVFSHIIDFFIFTLASSPQTVDTTSSMPLNLRLTQD